MIEWIKAEATVKEEGIKKDVKGQWYKDLKGETVYDKLVDF